MIWEVIAASNRYIDQMAPWALQKADKQRMRDVLAILSEVIRQIAIYIQPIMPDSAGKILDHLGVLAQERIFCFVGGDARLSTTQKIGKPTGIFPRFSKEGKK